MDGSTHRFSSVGFYSKTTKLRLPLTSVVEEFKAGKARLIMTLKDARDSKVREAGGYVQSGQKWKANEAIVEAESRLRHKSEDLGTDRRSHVYSLPEASQP